MSDLFLNRADNLVIPPHGHNTVWWYEKGKVEQNKYGLHGELSRQEMEIPPSMNGVKHSDGSSANASSRRFAWASR